MSLYMWWLGYLLILKITSCVPCQFTRHASPYMRPQTVNDLKKSVHASNSTDRHSVASHQIGDFFISYFLHHSSLRASTSMTTTGLVSCSKQSNDAHQVPLLLLRLYKAVKALINNYGSPAIVFPHQPQSVKLQISVKTVSQSCNSISFFHMRQ